MKQLILLPLLILSFQFAYAETPSCVIAEIKSNLPMNYSEKNIDFSSPMALQTTDGAFHATVIFQDEQNGLSIQLTHKDIKTLGFFGRDSKTPIVLSLEFQGRVGQMNCWLD